MATSLKSVLLVIIFAGIIVTSLAVGWNITGNVSLISIQDHAISVREKIDFARALLSAPLATGAAEADIENTENIALASAELTDEAEQHYESAMESLTLGDVATAEEELAIADDIANQAIDTILSTAEEGIGSRDLDGDVIGNETGDDEPEPESNEPEGADTAAPTISSVTYASQLEYGASQAISFSVSDDILVESVTLELDNANHSLSLAQNYYYSYIPSSGNHTFAIHASDNSSNSASSAYTFMVASQTEVPQPQNSYTNSTIESSTIAGSSLINSVVLSSTVINSTIRNSRIDDMIVQNALIENHTVYRGVVTFNNQNYTANTNLNALLTPAPATSAINYTTNTVINGSSENQYYSNLSAGEHNLDISFSNSSLAEVTITLASSTYGVNLSISQLNSFSPYSANAIPYQFINITPYNISGSAVSEVLLNFIVPNSWLASNNINDSTVKLHRYSYDTGAWTVLATTRTTGTSSTQFSASSPGFSVFALAGEKATLCGNSVCDSNETVDTCPADCAVEEEVADNCGNGACDADESSETCPADCEPESTCGNGACDADETSESCPQDCFAMTGSIVTTCGDGTCDADETSESCPQDCAAKTAQICGNSICEAGEDKDSCPGDCKKSISINNVWGTLILLFVIIGIALYGSTFAKKTTEKRSAAIHQFVTRSLQSNIPISAVLRQLAGKGMDVHAAENIIFEKITQNKDVKDLHDYILYHHTRGKDHAHILRELLNVGWDRELVMFLLYKVKSKKSAKKHL